MKGRNHKSPEIAEADLTALVLNDLEGAAQMLSQALRRLHPSLDLFQSIKEADEKLDDVVFAPRDGDYDKKGNAL